MNFLKSVSAHWAYAKAAQAVHKRTIEPWHLDPKERAILFVLPYEIAIRSDFWQFIGKLQVKANRLSFVVSSTRPLILPPLYIANSCLLKPEDLNPLGMPKKEIRDKAWANKPHLAIDLHYHFNPASAYLVGASSAQFRIGPYHPDGELYYDLMVDYNGHEQTGRNVIQELRRQLESIEPMAVVFKPEPRLFAYAV